MKKGRNYKALPACAMERIPMESGVYALYSADVCVYVGSSKALRERIGTHNHAGKFDRAIFELCAEADLVRYETEWIENLKPTLNVMKPVAYIRRGIPRAWFWNSNKQRWEKSTYYSSQYRSSEGKCIAIEKADGEKHLPEYLGRDRLSELRSRNKARKSECA
jgi:hypothetical protein